MAIRYKLWIGALVLPVLAAVYVWLPPSQTSPEPAVDSVPSQAIPQATPPESALASADSLAMDSLDSNVSNAPDSLRAQQRELASQGIACGIGVGESSDEQIAVSMSEDDARAQIAKGNTVLGRTTVQQSTTLYNKAKRTYTIFTLMVSKPAQ